MTYEAPDEETYERELAFSHHGGAANAIEECASFLLSEASDYFRVEQDNEAKLLRRLAAELTRRGKAERNTQQKFHRKGDPSVTR